MSNEEMIEQAELMLEYFCAKRDGKPFRVEYRSIEDNKWGIVDNPAWNFYITRYRKRQEPREYWLNCACDCVDSDADAYYKREDAERAKRKYGGEIVHVMEIIE